MAEKEGFEPSIPFWGIHDFQSCALGQLRDFSICVCSLPAASLTAWILYYDREDLSRENLEKPGEKENSLPNQVRSLAEKEGFEPSIPFWGIHDFQSCALGQLRDFSICVCSLLAASKTAPIYYYNFLEKSSIFFKFQQKGIALGVGGTVQVDGGGFVDRKAASLVDHQGGDIVLADMGIDPGNALLL